QPTVTGVQTCALPICEVSAPFSFECIVAAVRINPLETEGRTALAAVMQGRPDIVLMSKVAEPSQVAMLEKEVEEFEQRFGIPFGSTELAPNIESARGIMQTYAIARASQRVTE